MHHTQEQTLLQLSRIQSEIAAACARSGRNPQEITLVAVTKTVEPALVNCVLAAGVSVIGENRMQEFLQKQPDYQPGYSMHFIGHLQTNKAAQAVRYADVIASVDSLHLLAALEKEAARQEKQVSICLEWNVGDENSKTGAGEAEIGAMVEAVKDCPHLTVIGLMCIPPYSKNPEDSRPYFVRMRQLFEQLKLKSHPRIRMEILSMGMSGDFAVAIEEGATHVRIGSLLFGHRDG